VFQANHKNYSNIIMTNQVKFMFLAIVALLLVNCNEEPSTGQKAQDALAIKPIKQDNTEVEVTKEPILIASEKVFYGIEVQRPLADYADKLSKTTTENGEGTFEVYEIKNDEGEVLAQVHPDPMDEALVGDIIILNEKVITDKGVKIGTTFEELKAKFNDYKVHGSEIESRVHFYQGNHAYRLDYPSNQYDLDKSEIPADAKVIEITIMKLSDL